MHRPGHSRTRTTRKRTVPILRSNDSEATPTLTDSFLRLAGSRGVSRALEFGYS